MNSHNLLAPPSDGVIATTSGVTLSGSRSPGKTIIMTTGPTPFDALVTSVTTQMMTNTEQICTTSSAGALTSLIGPSESSPTPKTVVANDFSDTVDESKNVTIPNPEEPATQNDVTFSTKPDNASELNPAAKAMSVPLTVKEISDGAQKIGDMVVPPGPAPPITGMVPQEMVKMTDNDLISYINPSCFDQG